MSRSATLVLALLTHLPLVTPALAQATPPQQTTRTLLVNVVDRKGNPVSGLTKTNFRVRLNGKPVAILSAAYSVAPRRIVVLLDMSGSMGGNLSRDNTWLIAREAVQDVLEQMPADTPIAFLTFSDHVLDAFDLSQSRSSLVAWLQKGRTDRSDVKGRTALRDAIIAGTKLFRQPQPGDAIYAITDGGDNASHISTTNTTRALLGSGVRFYAFAFRVHYFPTEEERLGEGELEEMVRDSGGFVFGVTGGVTQGVSFLPSWDFQYDYNEKTRDTVNLYTQMLKAQVNGFYTLRFDAPASRKESKIKLELKEESGAAKKNVAFTYQRILPAENSSTTEMLTGAR